MSSVRQTSEQSESSGGLWNVVGTVRNSVLLMMALAGALLVLFGYVINVGVWAAIYAVWGTGLMLVGLSGYAIIWWKRR